MQNVSTVDQMPSQGGATQGFADTISAPQSVFRSVLNALSQPGRQFEIPILPTGVPTAMPAGLAAIILTLADYETPLWLGEELAADEDVRQFLAFHTGAPITNKTSEATFALCTNAESLPDFEQFALGTLEYPDRSTTIIVAVEGFHGGQPFHMEGPGINGRASLAPVTLPKDFASRLVQNRVFFPCGIDLILVAGRTVVGLPRSINVVE